MTRIAAFVLVVASGVAFADPVPDQSFTPSLPTGTTATVGLSNSVDWSQTFTVGLTGTLTSFDVAIRTISTAFSPLLVDLRTTSGGLPTEADAGANVLFSTSVTGIPNDPNFTIHSFVVGVPVTAGDVLAIVLRSDDLNPVYGWAAVTTDSYAGGAAFRRLFSGTWGTSTAGINELWFRTFVDQGTAPVPEPALLGLLVTGFGLAWVVRHTRRDARESR
jgi:hypothetical protein